LPALPSNHLPCRFQRGLETVIPAQAGIQFFSFDQSGNSLADNAGASSGAASTDQSGNSEKGNAGLTDLTDWL